MLLIVSLELFVRAQNLSNMKAAPMAMGLYGHSIWDSPRTTIHFWGCLYPI